MLRRALVLAVALLLASQARAQDQDPWFGRDKALHFGVSAGLAAGIYFATALETDHVRTRAAAAIILTLTAGVMKEAWDLAGPGDASWRDLTWDFVGTMTGVLFAYGIEWAIGRLWGGQPAPP
jgi:putative lipoprotein